MNDPIFFKELETLMRRHGVADHILVCTDMEDYHHCHYSIGDGKDYTHSNRHRCYRIIGYLEEQKQMLIQSLNSVDVNEPDDN